MRPRPNDRNIVGRNMHVHRTENEGRIHGKRGILLTLTRFMHTENPTFSVGFFASVNSNIRSIIRQFSFAVNAGKQIIFRH